MPRTVFNKAVFSRMAMFYLTFSLFKETVKTRDEVLELFRRLWETRTRWSNSNPARNVQKGGSRTKKEGIFDKDVSVKKEERRPRFYLQIQEEEGRFGKKSLPLPSSVRMYPGVTKEEKKEERTVKNKQTDPSIHFRRR